METIAEPKIDKWGTVDGRWIKAENLTHQHASNIFYYVCFIAKNLYPNWTRRAASNLIQERFGGVKLPYVPHYEWEKSHLKSKGMVDKNNNIIVDGTQIGVLN